MQFCDPDYTRSRTHMSDNNTTNAGFTLKVDPEINVMLRFMSWWINWYPGNWRIRHISIASSQHVNKIRSEMEVAPHNKLYFKQCSHSVIHCLVLTLLQCQCRPLSQKHRPPSLPHITCRGVSSRLNIVNDKMLDHWIPYVWATVNDCKYYIRLPAVRTSCLTEIYHLSAQKLLVTSCLHYILLLLHTAYNAYNSYTVYTV